MYKYRTYLSVTFFYLTRLGNLASETVSNFKLEVDGVGRSLEGNLVFNSGYHDIVFYLPYQKDHNYSFEFRLAGLENWQKSNYPIARYTNLGGGNYIFQTKLFLNNVLLGQEQFSFEIKEDFWEKWWFWLFVGSVVIAVISITVYFWILYDFRQRMKVQEIRQRIAADLHDEIGANLSSITFFVELLRRKLRNPEGELRSLLERISRNSQESASLINDTIWALNPDYDSFEKLVEKMKNFAAEILASKDIPLTFQRNCTAGPELSIEQRRDIYLIFKEITNNIAKHSKANQVIVTILFEKNILQISVKDDGIGFDTAKIYNGNGLKNYNHRARGGQTEVKIHSGIGLGTEIMIITHGQNHLN